MAIRVDIRRAQRKFTAQLAVPDKNWVDLVSQAGDFTEAKLRTEILNGEPGISYPKSYPSSFGVGTVGYVGVITSLLRTSWSKAFSSKYSVVVSSAGVPYLSDIILWSINKYGKSFLRIFTVIYSPLLRLRIAARIKESVQRTTFNNINLPRLF